MDSPENNALSGSSGGSTIRPHHINLKFRHFILKKRWTLLLIVLIALISALVVLMVRIRRADTLPPELPLADVSGVWADSVFRTLSPLEKIQMLLITSCDQIAGNPTQNPPEFSSGGMLLCPDSLNTYSGFRSNVVQLPAPGLYWVSTPDSIPEYSVPLNTDQMLSVSDDSLLYRYFEYHLSLLQSTGSTFAHYPLWKSLLHSPELPDTHYIKRQAELFKLFCNSSLARGIIPGIALSPLIQQQKSPKTRHDTLIFNYFRLLIDSTVPLIILPSIHHQPGNQVLQQSLAEQFGFRGLLVLTAGTHNSIDFFKNLEQGIDMQLCSSTSANELARQVSEEYIRDKRTRKLTDAAVKRVLLYREWLRSHTSGNQTGVPQPHEVRKLKLELATQSLTLLQDPKGIIPLNPMDPVCLHIPAGFNATPFNRVVEFFASSEVRYYQAGKPLRKKSGASQVLLRVRGIPLPKEGWKNQTGDEKLLVVDFGSPDFGYSDDDLPLPLIHAADTSTDNQMAVANALYGGLICNGVIPRDIHPKLRGGTRYVSGSIIRIQHTLPEAVGFSGGFLQSIDSIVEESIANGAFPGCQVFIAIQGKVICNQSYGNTAWEEGLPVQWDHLYDLASVTKIAATTLAAMKKVEEGELRIKDPLGKYLKYKPDHSPLTKEVRGSHRSSNRTLSGVTVYELLTHTSGLPASMPVTGYTSANRGVRDRSPVLYSNKPITDSAEIQVAEGMYLYRWAFDTLRSQLLSLQPESKKRYQYSDLNMILLQQIIDTLNTIQINAYMQRDFYEPLGLRNCLFQPLQHHPPEKIAPTALDLRWRNCLLRGTVHDPLSALFGGIAGNAGLFSNAHDLGVIGQMLLNGGTYGGIRFFDTATVKLFTARQPGLLRGLGFDIPAAGQGIIAASSPASCYGHTGYTGTCLWIDPENGIVFAFVSNRIHPNTSNQKINFFKVRERLHQAIYDEMQKNGIPFRGREG